MASCSINIGWPLFSFLIEMESVDWLSCLLFPVLKLIILPRRDRDGGKKNVVVASTDSAFYIGGIESQLYRVAFSPFPSLSSSAFLLFLLIIPPPVSSRPHHICCVFLPSFYVSFTEDPGFYFLVG